MAFKNIINDFHYLIGTLAFGLFVLLVTTAPSDFTAMDAAGRVLVGYLSLGVAALVFALRPQGMEATEGHRAYHRPVIIDVRGGRHHSHRAA